MADVPNIVARRLRTAAKAEVHPDPDLITGFVERSLDPLEQTAMLKHLARCADCREVVALALPEQLDGAAASQVAPAPSAWLAWPVLRWGTVAACVVVVGAAVTLHYESIQTARPAITAPASDAPVVPGKAAVELPKETAGATAQALSQNVTSQATPSATKAAPSGENVQVIPGRAKDESELSSAAKMSMPGSATPSIRTLASSAMIARAATVPANVTPRWTLTPEGMLQRSIDSGKTWETILVATPGTFRALTANGFDIWVGGAKGALYHSMDAGQHWMRVQAMAGGESLKADIIGIEFTDLLHGTLTTADKHTWMTTDAGQNWQKQ